MTPSGGTGSVVLQIQLKSLQMKFRMVAPMALVLALSACSGNPLGNVAAPVVVVPPQGSDGGISRDGLPPGTTNPSRSNTISRYEAKDDQGGGYVTSVKYNGANDTFQVTSLAFDGGGVYTRGKAVGQLGPYAVYESAANYTDAQTGKPITPGQLTHRAIYAVSTSGQTEFAIVRTGSFVGYGFGGFLYQRNGTVTLPTTGQASYSGAYAGLRDFQGRGGLEYATGDMTMAIDFDGYGGSGAVQAQVRNRAVYDINGNDITASVLSALTTKTGVTQTALPTLVFEVGPGVLDVNGEMIGQVSSGTFDSGGAVTSFEAGNYYAIVSGANANEVVGVLVVTANDPRFSGVTVRETGGFILNRP